MPDGIKVKSCEIRVVANGYWVGPALLDGRDPGRYLTGENIHVFETFDGLVNWLKENLVSKNDR